jgi:hypothetical protein
MAYPPAPPHDPGIEALVDMLLSQKRQPALTLSDALNLNLFSPSPIVEGRWFKDVVVYLDGYVFERCRFDRCQLITEQATFTFRQCVISSDCGVVFSGLALKVARLLMNTLKDKGRVEVMPAEQNLLPLITSDGTFTLE